MSSKVTRATNAHEFRVARHTYTRRGLNLLNKKRTAALNVGAPHFDEFLDLIFCEIRCSAFCVSVCTFYQ
jgi:hypothetical protein